MYGRSVCDEIETYLSSNATQGLILCWEPVFQRSSLSTSALCPHAVCNCSSLDVLIPVEQKIVRQYPANKQNKTKKTVIWMDR